MYLFICMVQKKQVSFVGCGDFPVCVRCKAWSVYTVDGEDRY